MTSPTGIPLSAPVAAWVQYCQHHGCRSVPIGYVTPHGFRLGRLEDRTRVAYALGTLPAARVDELAAVGFGCTPHQARRFDPVATADSTNRVMLALLAAYREEHGHADVPANYVAATGERLGQWLFRRIKKWRSDLLPDEERAPLEALGVSRAPRSRGPRIGSVAPASSPIATAPALGLPPA